MRVPGLKNRKFIGSAMLAFLLVQLFSVHFHFEHAEHRHDVHVHASFFQDHDFDMVQAGHAHGEEKAADATAWLAKKLSPIDLQVVVGFVLILSAFFGLRMGFAREHDFTWRYLHFFSPPLRAPPE